jgi:hypothetical protein
LEFKRLFETKASHEKGDYVTFSNAALFLQQRISGAALFSWPPRALSDSVTITQGAFEAAGIFAAETNPLRTAGFQTWTFYNTHDLLQMRHCF